jgi:hypothetical protein
MHTKLNLHCISATVEVFVRQHSKDLAAVYAVGNKKFSLVTFLQKTGMSETGVTVAWIEMYEFIALKYLWYKGLQSRKAGKTL